MLINFQILVKKRNQQVVAMATSAEIREGFLCPMCMKDLGTVTQLQSHFEESHSTEDKAVFNHLRGMSCSTT